MPYEKLIDFTYDNLDRLTERKYNGSSENRAAKDIEPSLVFYSLLYKGLKIREPSPDYMTNSYAYENDRLKTINVNNALQYRFNYDAFGRTTSTEVGNGTNFKTLSSLEYNNAGLLSKQTYGNGNFIDFTYDNLDRLTEKKYNGDNTSRVQYAYDSEGRTSTIKDIENSRYTRFTYDLAGRIVRSATYPNASASSAFVTDMRYNYESKTNRLSSFTYRIPKHGSTTGDYYTADFELIYGTGADADRVTALQMHNVNHIQFAYDGFGRVASRTYSNTIGDNRRVTTYTYQDVGTDKTTTLLKTVNNSGIGLLDYEYDAVGNITQISKDGTVQESYTYDDLNQLKTVTRNGVTTEYAYQNGNITSVTQNGTAVKTYGYTDSTWGDLLTSFNGQTITYDEIGNPLQYRDGISFTWEKGRQLQSIAKNGLNASYTYDENGLRLSKTVNGVTTKIFRTNGQMVGMNSSDGKDMAFLLDGNGNVYGVHYDHYSFDQANTETYYFAYSAQGDVIGIYDFSGKVIATYDYDEWGNCTVNALCEDNNGHAVDSPDHIAYANPFRYRGYFYDTETGFYYLNSRYYDPEIGRFISSDEQLNNDLSGNNLFAYCSNNPIVRSDTEGTGWWIPACAAVGAVLGFAGKVISNVTTGSKWYTGVIGATVGGLVGGLLAGVGLGKLSGFAGAFVESTVNQAISYSKHSWLSGSRQKTKTKNNFVNSAVNIAKDTLIEGTASLATNKVAGKIIPVNNNWFKPQKLISSFFGKHALKSTGQGVIQEGMNVGIDSIRYGLTNTFSEGQEPTIIIYPETFVDEVEE